jgi:hypothetical protein
VKILKWVVGVGVGVVALLFLIGLCLPRQFRVERSTVIAAPREQIHPVINRFREWPTWTAWNKERYPDMEVTFAGPEEGIGAKYLWTGEETGQGEMEITATDPAKGIAYNLAFNDGQMLSTGGLDYAPDAGGTKVTWWAAGDLGWSPVGRYFGLMMDGMMGPDFAQGLANLKARVEADAKPAADKPAAEKP